MSKLTVLMLVIAALLVTGAASGVASARPVSKGDKPHTSVSSDGSVPAANDAGVQRGKGEAYVESAPGTGHTVTGSGATTSDPEVAAVPLPSDGVGIQSVIGADGRYRITGTTTYPYSAITHITSSIGGCTGWLINANTVVTAGHCVYGDSGWAANVRVYPGRNGSSTPYGSCGASRLYSVTGWTQSRSRDYDYGAIKLNCSIGNSTGSFGYRWQSATLTGQATYLAGYPGDKTYATMWRHNDQVRSTYTRTLRYANDTASGQSGAPVWNGGASCSPCGIAIHAYGVDSTGYNGGTRITEAVFNNLTNWKNS
jgi:glutamyl endopeptidase